MPIPLDQIRVAEIHFQGIATAAGSQSKLFDLSFHYRRTSVVIPPSKAQLDAVFQSTVATAIVAALNVRFTQQRNTVRWVNDALDPPLKFPHTLPGLVAGDSMPVSASAFILFNTGLRGKSYRGGKHLGPMSESDTTLASEDLFNAPALTRLGNAASAMLVALTDGAGNQWIPVILSRKLSVLTTNPTTVLSNDVTTVSINKRVGWMRHRRVASVY